MTHFGVKSFLRIVFETADSINQDVGKKLFLRLFHFPMTREKQVKLTVYSHSGSTFNGVFLTLFSNFQLVYGVVRFMG